MNPLPKYNEKGELDTRLRLDPVTGDVGIGTPKLETKNEPVGWIDNKGNMICTKINESCRPLYTTPQPQRIWVGLTPEEIEEVWVEMCGFQSWARHSVYARKLEAKLKEKNT